MEPNSHKKPKNITGTAGPVKRRGEGLNTGPVGRQDGYAGRQTSSGRQSGSGRASGGGKGGILAIIIALLLGGGGGLTALLSGGGSDSGSGSGGSSSSGGGGSSIVSTLLGGFGGNASSAASSWLSGLNNTGKLNTEVDSAAAPKRTVIKGNSQDVVTIMVYMCGTDLESRSGMATNDMREMAQASLNKNINIIIYTGGCKGWKTNGISSSTNQIYKIQDGQLAQIVADAGDKPMTDPATLTEFIKFCAQHYPADRNELIFWDHGGGSLSGFGYDEVHKNSGSMNLSQMNQALKDSGVKFDFIGFDACLMATLETAVMTSNYADYLIASEETEPGIGWYYTDWLNELSRNTSMPTLEIGKNIVDGFVDECDRKCPGQKTTLSVVDLAELSATVPSRLSSFSSSTSALIKGDDYKKVSDARAGSREFSSSGIDQVDLVNFAENVGTTEAKALSQTLLKCVKYNRTSSSMSNAYGLSVYFPYRKTGSVGTAVSNNNNIGLGSEYSDCIKAFASLETGGQISAGGSGSPLGSLLGGAFGGSSGASGSDGISSLINAFLGGGRSVDGIDRANTDYMDGMDVDSAAGYIAKHQFDTSALKWTTEADGTHTMSITQDNWKLIQDLQVNIFIDDGTGYVDLGLDNEYEFDSEGKLVGDTDGTWHALGDQVCAYYHVSEVKDSNGNTITTGRIPCYLDGVRAELIAVFDKDNPYGYIAGARYVYVNNETDTIAKSVDEVPYGTRIEFCADYYDYNGNYQNSYKIGKPFTYDKDTRLSYMYLSDKTKTTYLLTDIYNREYWTPSIP
ncbi:MAG: peptidase C11 [Eubacterium sp.]|nr:peptidase C11 [Eubacterium sp.]